MSKMNLGRSRRQIDSSRRQSLPLRRQSTTGNTGKHHLLPSIPSHTALVRCFLPDPKDERKNRDRTAGEAYISSLPNFDSDQTKPQSDKVQQGRRKRKSTSVAQS